MATLTPTRPRGAELVKTRLKYLVYANHIFSSSFSETMIFTNFLLFLVLSLPIGLFLLYLCPKKTTLGSKEIIKNGPIWFYVYSQYTIFTDTYFRLQPNPQRAHCQRFSVECQSVSQWLAAF